MSRGRRSRRDVSTTILGGRGPAAIEKLMSSPPRQGVGLVKNGRISEACQQPLAVRAAVFELYAESNWEGAPTATWG